MIIEPDWLETLMYPMLADNPARRTLWIPIPLPTYSQPLKPRLVSRAGHLIGLGWIIPSMFDKSSSKNRSD